MTRYEHTQIGHTIIWGIVATTIFVATLATLVPGSPGGLLVTEVILLGCAILFWKLTIRIENGTLRASFGPGLVHKTAQLSEIAECEPVRIPWWYGWGIRLTPHGWLYNVSGLDAVVITLRNGKKFALGTDDPYGLTNAIRRFISAY